MSYQLNKMHLIICIIAALTITAGFVIHSLLGSPFGLFTMALWVSLVIVCFYFLGHIARHILISRVFMEQEEEELDEVTEDEFEEEIFNAPENPELMTETDLTGYDDSEDGMFEEHAEEELDPVALGDVL